MSSSSINSIDIIDLGRMPYGEALLRQQHWHETVASGGKSVVLTVEHDPVLTMGKNSDHSNLLFSPAVYREMGVDFFDTERGGEVTAHMPGQLVIYPVIHVGFFKLSVREYVRRLEDAVIETLESYGIHAATDENYPGVWVGAKKICAIGVRIKSRVTMHGLALNINNDLSLFTKIIPCGIKARGVTSMAEILGQLQNTSAVRQDLLHNICNQLIKG